MTEGESHFSRARRGVEDGKITVGQAARMLNISVSAVHHRLAKGQAKGTKQGPY